MERLTEWINDKEDAIPRTDSNKIGHRDYMKKLAEYEDLEEQGLLLKLPCKVGDVVYWIREKEVECPKGRIYDDFECLEVLGCKDWADCDVEYELYICKHTICNLEWIIENYLEFDKYVFLTEEQAEQALAEMKSEVKP